MFVSIIVNLYTVRLLWEVLGIDNYGIYNVVGGIVLIFAFLNNAMISSSQRFISFALGKGDKERLQRTFSMSITVHIILAIIVLFLAETIGIWFLNEKLNIPSNRMYAANWVFQCSVISFLLNIISVPYNACIVAHEHMKIYGYFGILDVLLKLIIVLIVAILPIDPLISYAILILCVSGIMRLIYSIYCRHNFDECKFIKFKDKTLMKEMFSFAGWSFLGNMGISVRDQGINILLNLFFGVTVNAAKGIANQVGGVINGFTSSFTMAVNPQITKRYANGEYNSMIDLMFTGCRYALLLMSFIIIPLIIATEDVLKLWLGEVAPYTVGFLRLVLIMSWIDCITSPIITSIQATGKIKKFQIVISLILFSSLPISWWWLKYGGSPYSVMIICIILSISTLITRLILLNEIIPFSYKKFFNKVYIRTVPCIIISLLISCIYYQYITNNIWGLITFGLSSGFTTVILTYLIILSPSERSFAIQYLKNIKIYVK